MPSASYLAQLAKSTYKDCTSSLAPLVARVDIEMELSVPVTRVPSMVVPSTMTSTRTPADLRMRIVRCPMPSACTTSL